jgi:hypothetical protein
MAKQSGDPAERLLRQIHEAVQKQTALLAKHTQRLESLESKLDQVLETLLDEAAEFEDEFEAELGAEGPVLDELIAEIDKLPPEEVKRRLAEAITMFKAESEKGDPDEGEDDETPF